MKKELKSNAIKSFVKKCRSKRGFTLLEMITTVAILAIVSSLSFEAMVIASEEYRRVEALSECERSISLFQETVNTYAKNAAGIYLVDKSGETGSIDDVISDYIDWRNTDEDLDDPLQDAENNPDNEYIDIFIYRSGEMTYNIAQYDQTNGLEPVVTINGVKSIDWSCKPSQITTSYPKQKYILDYAVSAPTSFELLYSKTSGQTFQTDDAKKYNRTEGVYSVMTGTVLNNMENSPIGPDQLIMCEDTSGFYSTSEYVDNSDQLYKGDLNFVVIRTVPRVAK